MFKVLQLVDYNKKLSETVIDLPISYIPDPCVL
jgi:hypothetical protein